MRDFSDAMKILHRALIEKNPETFSSSWIHVNVSSVYWYMRCHMRTSNGKIDWDKVVSTFKRSRAKRWYRYGCRNIRIYERQTEVDRVLNNYKSTLYTLLAPVTELDKQTQNKILMNLVRVGQRGNITAQDEVIKWVSFITDEWIDRYPLNKWQPYPDEVRDKIFRCIRNYRYHSSFLIYLLRTLQLAGRGKPPLVSLDDKFTDGRKTRIEYLVVEEESADAFD